VFEAVGARVRQLPMTSERVLDAMQASSNGRNGRSGV
jgi:hypothetical protein